MNKFAKLALGVAAVACTAVAVTGCAPAAETYEGEYYYANAWSATSPEYGVKVKITAEKGVITKVEIVDSEYTNVTSTWDNAEATTAAIPEYLTRFKGKTLADINALKVTDKPGGEPASVSDSSLVISGSTQTSGRIILAMQDAIRTTGKAYGLAHGAGYVAMASVSYFEGEMVAADLVEVCLPTYVVADETVAAEDVVVATVVDHGAEVEKRFYKTVSYGDVTYTYDATKGDYVSGDKTFKENMATEANAKAYFEAVVKNEVAVTVGGEKVLGVMSNAKLNKEVNGYWMVDTNDDGTTDTSKWLVNRDATIEYLLANGIDSLLGTAKNDDGYWANGTLVSGATWTDLNKEEATGYFTYAQLLKNAVDAAK